MYLAYSNSLLLRVWAQINPRMCCHPWCRFSSSSDQSSPSRMPQYNSTHQGQQQPPDQAQRAAATGAPPPPNTKIISLSVVRCHLLVYIYIYIYIFIYAHTHACLFWMLLWGSKRVTAQGNNEMLLTIIDLCVKILTYM